MLNLVVHLVTVGLQTVHIILSIEGSCSSYRIRTVNKIELRNTWSKMSIIANWNNLLFINIIWNTFSFGWRKYERHYFCLSHDNSRAQGDRCRVCWLMWQVRWSSRLVTYPEQPSHDRQQKIRNQPICSSQALTLSYICKQQNYTGLNGTSVVKPVYLL